MQNFPPGGKELTYTYFFQCTRELGTYRIYMCEVTLKAGMRSYLVGKRSKVLSDTFYTSILKEGKKERKKEGSGETQGMLGLV